mgnify:CR=1 FL=1
MMKSLTYIPFLILSISSCTVFYPLVGIRNAKQLSDEKIEKYARKVGITNENIYKIDPSLFGILDSIKNKSLRNDLIQPLQFIYFDASDSAQLHLPNCYVGGFPKLLWNNEGSFDQYPPERKIFGVVDTVFYKPDLMRYIVPLQGNSVHPEDFEGEVIIILYARVLHKNAKHLVKLMDDYQSKFPEAKVVYVNTDNGYFFDEL